MRTILRSLASAALGGILLLSIGAGATLAKGHDVETYDLDDAWCFQDVVELYCFEQEGEFSVTTKKNGVTVGSLAMTVTTVVTADGAFVARSTVTTRERTTTNPDGSYTLASRERTRWTDGQTSCTTDVRLRIVDFEVVVDTVRSDCF